MLSDQSLRVLLVEDNPVNQMLALRLLQRHGHSVAVAGNGREALTHLDSHTVDLVVMDVQMPEMDGLTATRTIRQRETGTTRRLPIVALTANALREDEVLCLDAGMDEFVAKPVQAQVLLAAISRALGAPGQRSA